MWTISSGNTINFPAFDARARQFGVYTFPSRLAGPAAAPGSLQPFHRTSGEGRRIVAGVHQIVLQVWSFSLVFP